MIMNKKNLVVIAWLAVSTMMSAQSVYPGQHQGKMKKETVAPIRVQSFDLKDVRLLASRFRDNMLRDSAWMTSLDVNRLLHSFRTNAGVFAGREGGYMTVKKTRWLGISGLRTSRTYYRTFAFSLRIDVRCYRK